LTANFTTFQILQLQPQERCTTGRGHVQCPWQGGSECKAAQKAAHEAADASQSEASYTACRHGPDQHLARHIEKRFWSLLKNRFSGLSLSVLAQQAGADGVVASAQEARIFASALAKN